MSTDATGGALVASLRSEPAGYNRYVEPRPQLTCCRLLTHGRSSRSIARPTNSSPALAESWTPVGRRPDLHAQTAQRRAVLRRDARSRRPTSCSPRACVYDQKVEQRDRSPIRRSPASRWHSRRPDPFTGDRATAGAVRPRPAAARQHARSCRGTSWKRRSTPGRSRSSGRRARRSASSPASGRSFSPSTSPGQRLVFARNRNTGAANAAGVQLPYLEKLTIAIIPDQNTEALRMESGEIDLMSNGDIRAGGLRDVQAGERPGQAAAHRRRRRPRSEPAVVQPAERATALPGEGVPAGDFVRRRSPGDRQHGLSRRRRFRFTVRSRLATRPGTPRRRRPILTIPLARASCWHRRPPATREQDGLLIDAQGRPVRFSLLTQKGHTCANGPPR